MKKYLSFIQFACIAGVAYAFVTKNWALVAIFFGGLIITYQLNKGEQKTSGEATNPEETGLELLDNGMASLLAGSYPEARSDLRSAVSKFRSSQDQRLVVVGLTFQAVTEAADREIAAGLATLTNAERELEKLPADLLEISDWLREIHALTSFALDHDVPNPIGLIADVKDIAERAAREPW